MLGINESRVLNISKNKKDCDLLFGPSSLKIIEAPTSNFFRYPAGVVNVIYRSCKVPVFKPFANVIAFATKLMQINKL